MKFSYDKIFEKMHEMGMNRSDLINKAGISTNQMAKMGKSESITLENAVKVCSAVGLTLADIGVKKD